MLEEEKKWMKSIGLSLLAFLVFSVYLYLRRGYYNIYIINKVFGSSAVILASLTLLIGPLRKLPLFMRMMLYRRQLGLIAFLFAILHVIFSLLQLKRFPFPTWYLSEWLPITFGILAVLVWLYMTYISRNSKIKELGVDIWKKRLSLLGHVGFIAVFFHLVVMKYQGWIKWFQGQIKTSPELAHPSYPPASLLVFIIMAGILLFRLLHHFQRKSTQNNGTI